jgi:hypothetical protein
MIAKENLQTAFKNVVRRCALGDWTPASRDVTVTVEFQPLSSEKVCGFVEGIEDLMPGDLLQLLLSQIHEQDNDLRLDLAQNETYSTGARCLGAFDAAENERFP